TTRRDRSSPRCRSERRRNVAKLEVRPKNPVPIQEKQTSAVATIVWSTQRQLGRVRYSIDGGATEPFDPVPPLGKENDPNLGSRKGHDPSGKAIEYQKNVTVHLGSTYTFYLESGPSAATRDL